MSKIKLSALCIVAAFLLAAPNAQAVPQLISYQGQLNDQAGVPVNATVSFIFSIYDVASGGTALWTEAQTLPVTNGIFNVQLGAVTPLPSSVFTRDVLYLGIKAGADAEMAPRQRLTSGAFAFRAKTLTVPTPVGTIMAWAKSLPGVPALPDGWVECIGQTLSDPESPLHGTVIPNLNGAAQSGAVGGSETHYHTVHFAYGDFDPGQAYYSDVPDLNTSTVNHLPPYYEIVWILKVK
jgi:hypothetical protein